MDFSAFSAFDHAIFAWIQTNIWCPFLDAVMPVITILGEGGWFWIVVAVLFLFMKKYRKSGVTMAFALIVMLIVNDLILKEFKPVSVKVTLNKPQAVAEAQGVGVQISKSIGE